MANIVYRSGTTPGVNGATQNKGVPLLNSEIDGNFRGLQDEIITKANIASPALSGTPTAPTAAADTNTTQIATTAHVFAERTNTATLTNKTLTNPTINAASGVVVLPSAAAPAQTAEGSIVWDSDDDLLTVGTGTARKTIVDTDSTQSLTNKTVNRVTITAPATGSTLTIANGKTFTLNNTLTFTGTDSSSVAFSAGGTVAYQGGTLGQFAATTSAALAGVISDETGTGALVFADSPTLVTPIINTSLRVPIVYGSNANSANLTLSSTSAATKGAVLLGTTGDTVKLNTSTNGVVTTSASDGTFSVDTTVYYKAGGTDVSIADGGTGLSTTPGNGQILIGNAGVYSLGTLTAGTGIGVATSAGAITVSNSGVTALAGTANRVTVSGASGSVTLSGPQDIHSGATPSFVQVNLSSTPTASSHAATKEYVDNLAQGLDVKQSVRAATTATITLSGTQTIDAVVLIAGDRVLVKNQTAPAQNGIYLVAAGAWTRAVDMDAWAEIPGSFVFVEDGTVNADTGWVATANQGGTLGTTAITWAQFSGAGTYTAGGGIGLTGTTFSVAAGTGLTQDADGISHADTSAQASVDNTGNTFIQDITLDTFGHITAIASGTVTIGDGAFTVTAGAGLAGGGQLGTANQSTATSITVSHADTSAVADLTSATNTFISAQTYDTYGHVQTRTTGTVDFTVAANYAFQNFSIGTDVGYTWGVANTNTTQAAETSSDTLTLVNGSGINLYTSTVAGTDAIRVEHADTSSAANLSATARTYVTGLTFDTFGHVTAYTTGSETVTDTNTTYILDGSGTANNVNLELIAGGSGSGTDSINVQGAGATSVAWDEANQRITITSTDTQPNNGTLTMNVSGSGLTGSQTFTANQSSAATFTVTSNATSANTASTIVLRDASGNFTAGTITASLNGTANNITSQANSATIAATSANTVNQIVLRDASGNFTAGIITATDFNSTSDARLKTSVQSLDGIGLLSNVNPVQFNWKDSGKKSYGVIAQEIEQILPELIGEREDGMKSVHYIPLIAMLIDAVKKLDARVTELENN